MERSDLRSEREAQGRGLEDDWVNEWRPPIDRGDPLPRRSPCSSCDHGLDRNSRGDIEVLGGQMKERDADFYQSHKDDSQEWGDPQPRRPERRRLASMISVRFSPEEAKLVRREAKARKTSVSNFIRVAALKDCRSGLFPLEWVWHGSPTTVRDEWTAQGFQSGLIFWVAGSGADSKETLTLASSA